MFRKSIFVSILGGALISACGSDVPVTSSAPSTASSKSALSMLNGSGFNGRGFNGMSFNGRAFNGMGFNGRAFNGRAFNGRAFNGRAFNGLGFAGTGFNGTAFSGYMLFAERSELILKKPGVPRIQLDHLGGGVVLLAHNPADPSEDITIRISGPVEVGPVTTSRRVLSYLVEVWDAVNSAWAPAFTDDAGNALWTIPLNGLWYIADEDIGTAEGGSWVDDPAAITFAARGYALAKCVELGYLPWQIPLRPFHQACTRAIRADYCGDGRSFTRDGTLIDLYDTRRIQVIETSPPPGGAERAWEHEASWDENGARCLSAERIQDWAAGEEPVAECFGAPLASLYTADCGAFGPFGRHPLWAGELMRTEYVGWAAP